MSTISFILKGVPLEKPSHLHIGTKASVICTYSCNERASGRFSIVGAAKILNLARNIANTWKDTNSEVEESERFYHDSQIIVETRVC